MAEDLSNVRLSSHATAVAETLYNTGYFDDRVAIAKLGFAYAISNYYKKFNPSEIEGTLDSAGINYNVGTLDSDKSIAELVCSLYPETLTPYRLTRAIICYGLDKLGERNDRGELFPLYEMM